MKFTVVSIGKKTRRVRHEYTNDVQNKEVWVVSMIAVGIEGRSLDYVCENEQESQRFSTGQTRDIDI